MNYLIGSGYFSKPGDNAAQFFPIWHANKLKYSSPERILILANGGSHIPNAPGQWIHLDGNLGHTHDLTNHIKPYAMCGWSASIVTLAMLAYMDERDVIFVEQDCLAFGNWVQHLYAEIGNWGMIFGRNKVMACSQSLFLIKHAFIPEFVKLYMQQGTEQDKANECELKFARMESKHPDLFGRFSFGVDRDRPIDYDVPCFYAQQLRADEMEELRRRKLI